MRKKLIDKDALAREIERRIKYDEMVMDHNTQITVEDSKNIEK